MSANDLLCTYLDVVKLIPQLFDVEDNKFEMTSDEIRDHIFLNDAQVRTQLKNYYGASLRTTPYAAPPIPRPTNEGQGKLLLQSGSDVLVVKDDTAVLSQIYQFKFTSDTEFSCESDLGGDQGDGATGTDFTTTDTYLTVDEVLWSGNFAKDDVIYVKVYCYEGMLVHLCSLLTAQYILNTIYTEEVPNSSATAEKYGQLYNRLIKALQGGLIFLDQDLPSRDIDPVQTDYEIDQYGQDVTNYSAFEWSPWMGGLD